jgi:hypothetical protein
MAEVEEGNQTGVFDRLSLSIMKGVSLKLRGRTQISVKGFPIRYGTVQHQEENQRELLLFFGLEKGYTIFDKLFCIIIISQI